MVYEDAKRLLILLLCNWAQKKKQQKFCCTNQKPELPRPFETGPLRLCPQELFSSFLTFLRPNFLLARLDFFPPPLTAHGSPRMGKYIKPNTSTQEYFSSEKYRFFFSEKENTINTYLRYGKAARRYSILISNLKNILYERTQPVKKGLKVNTMQ